MSTDHLLLYKDLHRAPTVVEMDDNLEYLEGKIDAVETSSAEDAAAAALAKSAAETARDAADGFAADAYQSKLDAATSAAQALAAKNIAQGVRTELADPELGGSMIALMRTEIANAVATTLHYWMGAQPINVKAEFGAVLDGVADDTLPLQRALDTGLPVYLANGTARITDTLHFGKDGQVLFGDGKDSQSTITNTTNDKPLFTFSAGTGAVYRRRCGIEQIAFVGNTLTTEGIALRGIVDDGLTGDADKSCWMREVRIRAVGAGYGLRVSSWANTFNSVEIWQCYKGLKCGSEFNANAFHGLYINQCTQEAISSPDGAGQPAVNTFVNTVVQYSGGTTATIDLQEAYSYSFHGLYLEGNTSPCNVLLGSKSHGCTLTGVMHNLVSGTVGIQVVRNEGKGNTILGVINLGGTVDSLVRIEGTLPTTSVGGLHVSAGTATNGNLYDLSTRKATTLLDGLVSRFGPSVFRALTSENALEIRRSDTDVLQAFWQNGGLYFGADTTVPVLTRSGGTLSMTYSAGVGTFRAPQFGLGLTGKPIVINPPASPEGAYSAPPGSLALADNGTVYRKATGTGTTGWEVLMAGSQPYHVTSTFNGVPTASLLLAYVPLPLQVVFPAGLTGSQGRAKVAATAQTDFDIKKNGVSVGTMRFAAAATTATFIMASQTTFAAGDVLEVVAPASPDATLSTIGFVLAGTR